MTETREVISLQREELLRNLLPQSQLEYCHERYPGAVKLELVRRTRAVLRIRERPVYFHLSEEDRGQVAFTAEGAQATLSFEKTHPALWKLCFHTAAEAILALRNGHKEHARVSSRKKRTNQQADVT
jgi:hypothetical protein